MRARKARPFGRRRKPYAGPQRRYSGLKGMLNWRTAGWQTGGARVLHRGHAVYILVESVEKATDNGSASLLC
jgi:hypothetical protein